MLLIINQVKMSESYYFRVKAKILEWSKRSYELNIAIKAPSTKEAKVLADDYIKEFFPGPFEILDGEEKFYWHNNRETRIHIELMQQITEEHYKVLKRYLDVIEFLE
jgi:hypothetical protein